MSHVGGFRPERARTTMTDRYTDRVIAVEVEEKDEVELRLADWTPSGGYTALVDAADRAGLDLTEYNDGETVAVATLDADGNVESFAPPGDEFYADATVCFDAQLRLSVMEGAEEMTPTNDQWVDEVREVISEDVMDVYFDLDDPSVKIEEVWRE